MNAAAAAKVEHSVILVVEDEEASRETLRELLELEGFDVETAANGKEALEKLQSIEPCMMLLDLFMPIMDGWQLLDALRSDGRLSKMTIVVTTSAETNMPADVPVFRKPLDFDKLLRAVVAAC